MNKLTALVASFEEDIDKKRLIRGELLAWINELLEHSSWGVEPHPDFESHGYDPKIEGNLYVDLIRLYERPRSTISLWIGTYTESTEDAARADADMEMLDHLFEHVDVTAGTQGGVSDLLVQYRLDDAGYTRVIRVYPLCTKVSSVAGHKLLKKKE